MLNCLIHHKKIYICLEYFGILTHPNGGGGEGEEEEEEEEDKLESEERSNRGQCV